MNKILLLIPWKRIYFNSIEENRTNKEKLKRVTFFALISFVLMTISTGCGTPVFKAIKKSDYKKVEYLLDNGTNVNAFCVSGKVWTPLMVAAYYGNVQLAEILLKHGADPSVSNV
jgi:ankyrin repeat protein